MDEKNISTKKKLVRLLNFRKNIYKIMTMTKVALICRKIRIVKV